MGNVQARHRLLPFVFACVVSSAASVASANPAGPAGPGATPEQAPTAAPSPAGAPAPAPLVDQGAADIQLVARSRELYAAAEAAMAAGRFADAARDYALAYDGMKDPVLFYKIGVAKKEAGQCDTAVVYLQRYLREGAPSEEFRVTTEGHLAACGVATTATSAAPAPAPTAALTTAVDQPPSKRRTWAWTATGTSLATASLGAVMFLSAQSTSEEIDDLITIAGGPNAELTSTELARKHELEDERRTFRTVAWVSFGVAGAAAITATVLFLRDDPPPTRRLEVAPLMTPQGGGITVLGRF